MKKITVQFTFEELKAVLELVDNQLFRMKYIDPKIPGHLPNPETERAASSGVQSTLSGSPRASKPRLRFRHPPHTVWRLHNNFGLRSRVYVRKSALYLEYILIFPQQLGRVQFCLVLSPKRQIERHI
jgi:hypothetical protein